MQTNRNFVEIYFSNILSLSCKCAIDLSTCITENSKTLLDYIYGNENKHLYMNGVSFLAILAIILVPSSLFQLKNQTKQNLIN